MAFSGLWCTGHRSLPAFPTWVGAHTVFCTVQTRTHRLRKNPPQPPITAGNHSRTLAQQPARLRDSQVPQHGPVVERTLYTTKKSKIEREKKEEFQAHHPTSPPAHQPSQPTGGGPNPGQPPGNNASSLLLNIWPAPATRSSSSSSSVYLGR